MFHPIISTSGVQSLLRAFRYFASGSRLLIIDPFALRLGKFGIECATSPKKKKKKKTQLRSAGCHGTIDQIRNHSGTREKPCQLAGVGLSLQSSEPRSRNRPDKRLWNTPLTCGTWFFSFLSFLRWINFRPHSSRIVGENQSICAQLSCNPTRTMQERA